MRQRRTGAVRRSEIPPEVLAALNAGETETVNLVEWLAVDAGALLHNVAGPVGLDVRHPALSSVIARLGNEGVLRRLELVGAAVRQALQDHPRRAEVFEALATHPSDIARSWACYAIKADGDLDLAERLDRARRFAADGNMSVREVAWGSCRPYVIAELDRALSLFEPWVRDEDANIRRCAVEGTRPRGVWCAHIRALKEDPVPGLRLLEPVRSDPSRYVQNAVANWLNDASKSHPDWVREVCARWSAASGGKETAYIVRRGLRTLRKQEQ